MKQAEEANSTTAGHVWAAFAEGVPVSVDLLLRTKGDTRLWGQISFTPVLSEIDGTVENHVRLITSSNDFSMSYLQTSVRWASIRTQDQLAEVHMQDL